ncbi:MAG: MCP four helix bundle domain-containing protein [bacterium]
MKGTRRLSIKAVLSMSFASMALLVVVIGMTGYMSIRRTGLATDFIIHDRLPHLKAGFRLDSLQRAMRMNLLEMAAVGTGAEEFETYKKAYQTKANEFQQLANALLKGDAKMGIRPYKKGSEAEVAAAEVRNKFAAFQAQGGKLIIQKKQVIAHVAAGRMDETKTVVDGILASLVRGEFDRAGKDLEEAVSKVNSQSEAQMQETISMAGAAQASSSLIFMATIILGVIISVMLGVLITRTITQPLRKVSDYLNWETRMDRESGLDWEIKDDIPERMMEG